MQPRRVLDLVRQDHKTIVSATTTLREAASRLIQSESDLLAVTDEDGGLAGVVSESAVVRALLSGPLPGATIAPIMSRHVESIRNIAKISSVAFLFRSSCHTAIPVLDAQDRVCGLLLRRDVMAEILTDISQPIPHPAEQPKPVAEISSTPADPQPASEETGSPRTSGIVRIEQHSDIPNDGQQQRPHFLSGREARRRLKSGSDQFGGMSEPPW